MIVNGNLKFHTLGSGELQNAIMENFTTTARDALTGGDLVAGRIIFNSTTNEHNWYDGTAWRVFAGVGVGALQSEVDAIESASGGIFGSDGTWSATPLSGGTYINASTDLADALLDLDSAIATAAGVDTLGELSDVDSGIDTSVNQGDIIFWDTTGSPDVWNRTNLTGLSTNDLLQWNGTTWISVAPSSIGGNSFTTVSGDSGSAIADTTSDTLNLVGATNGGITTTATDDPESVTFGLTPVDLTTGAATLALGDFLIVSDSTDTASTVALKYTLQDVVDDLDIPNAITTNGLVVRTAEDTYTSRSIVSSAVAGDEGISIVNGDGVSGNPTIGLDIVGLTAVAGSPVISGTDLVVIYDGTNNVKATVSDLSSGIAANISLDDLSDVVDASAHTNATAYVLVGDGTNLVVEEVTAAAPSNFVEAVQDMIGSFLVSGTDTTVTYNDGANTIQVNVDDVFLRNTGDTLDSGTLTVASGATLSIASGGTLTITDAPTADTDAVNKAYADSISAGLDPKESVRVATTGALPAVTAAGSGVGKTLTANSVGVVTIDGEDITAANGFSVGDRILVKNQATASDNGIYTVTTLSDVSTALVLTRAVDQDGSPANEVSGGNFTFVEEGTTNADTGWVVVTNGTITVDTTNIDWSQFTGAGSFTAGAGIGQSGSTIFVQSSELSTATPVAADTLIFRDQDAVSSTDSNDRIVTINNFINDLGILTDSTGVNALTASDGVDVTGQDVSLDFNSLNNIAVTGTDILAFGDASGSPTFANHIKRTVNDFITDMSIATLGGSLTASDGVILSSGDIQLDIGALTSTNAIVGTDLLVFNDGATAGAGGVHGSRTFTNMMADLDIVNSLGGNGFAVQTAADTYVARTLTASATASEEGITITNGDGVSGNPTIGLDITGLTDGGVPGSTEELVVFDGTNNVKTTVSNLASAVAGASTTGDLSDVSADVSASGQVLVASGSPLTYTPSQIHFVSTQASATTWTVTHNLGQQFVQVTVYDSSNQVIIPQSITATSANVTTITFNTAISGTAVITGVAGAATESV